MKLAMQLKMDQYDAPKPYTPSSGLHYIFYVDGEQAKRIGSITCITYKGVKYAIDVKFKNGLCNCYPSKIDGYGKYVWEDAYQLLNIPKLPDKLFNMICKPEPKPT
ncbi:MAG: hypothetical protein ACKPKO_53440, partial [Candidatus Fonsibacter sp.]